VPSVGRIDGSVVVVVGPVVDTDSLAVEAVV
jgi:hypothetical protein